MIVFKERIIRSYVLTKSLAWLACRVVDWERKTNQLRDRYAKRTTSKTLK